MRSSLTPILLATALLGSPGSAAAASDPELVDLVVAAGRPLRVVLPERVRVKRVGQAVTGTLAETVYAYDRMVVPAGARVVGRIERLDRPPKGARWRGLLRLDLSPARPVVLRFDTLVLDDGTQVPLSTRVGPGLGSVTLSAAAPPSKGLASRAADAVTGPIKHTAALVKRRGALRKARDGVLSALPFHAQYIDEGTAYDAELVEPLAFGRVAALPKAPPGTPAPPDAVISARLLTGLSSATTPRGTTVQAVLTAPLLTSDERLIFPEGTELMGEVTYTRPARHLRRNGQLRLLFETARAPQQAETPLLASLYAAEVADSGLLSIDDEGGARITNPASRFVGPVLSAGALVASAAMEPVTEPGTIEPGVPPGALEPSSLGTAAGGYSGLGLIGVGLSQLSRSTAMGLGLIGLGRSMYGSFLGKGREVAFPRGTRLHVQLAPASPAPEPAP